LFMTLFHLSYRNCMEETFFYRNVSHDYSSNFQVIMWTLQLTNDSIENLENIFYQLQNNLNELFKEVYINLLKLLLWNTPLFFIINYYADSINVKYIQVIGLWAFVLLQYPTFKAFILILEMLIISIVNNFGNIGQKKNNNLGSNEKLIKIAEIIIPFYNLARQIRTKSAKAVLKNMNNAPEIVIAKDKKDENKLKQMLKYAIYEKQRWRIVAWSLDLKEEDGTMWVKKWNNKNIYFDKKKLELPREEYEWKINWEIEISTNTDKEGWEYAKSFDDESGKMMIKILQLERKWIRYSGLK